jgi:hypothetical protein
MPKHGMRSCALILSKQQSDSKTFQKAGNLDNAALKYLAAMARSERSVSNQTCSSLLSITIPSPKNNTVGFYATPVSRQSSPRRQKKLWHDTKNDKEMKRTLKIVSTVF